MGASFPDCCWHISARICCPCFEPAASSEVWGRDASLARTSSPLAPPAPTVCTVACKLHGRGSKMSCALPHPPLPAAWHHPLLTSIRSSSCGSRVVSGLFHCSSRRSGCGSRGARPAVFFDSLLRPAQACSVDGPNPRSRRLTVGEPCFLPAGESLCNLACRCVRFGGRGWGRQARAHVCLPVQRSRGPRSVNLWIVCSRHQQTCRSVVLLCERDTHLLGKC